MSKGLLRDLCALIQHGGIKFSTRSGSACQCFLPAIMRHLFGCVGCFVTLTDKECFNLFRRGVGYKQHNKYTTYAKEALDNGFGHVLLECSSVWPCLPTEPSSTMHAANPVMRGRDVESTVTHEGFRNEQPFFLSTFTESPSTPLSPPPQQVARTLTSTPVATVSPSAPVATVSPSAQIATPSSQFDSPSSQQLTSQC